MPLNRPIIYIDDDEDDHLLVSTALRELEILNPLVQLRNGQEALDYLIQNKTKPFLILCDINMPLMNGIALRREIIQRKDLVKQTTPFIFFTTQPDTVTVDLAFEYMVQGFYKKPYGYEDIKRTLSIIIEYWKTSLHPNI
nr:response regulator [uncultured Arsenicibacter sp.]